MRVLWNYPTAFAPVVLAAKYLVVMYYNLTMWGALSWIARKDSDACSPISAWLVEQFGEPVGKFVFTISFLYVMMMGIALLCAGLFKLIGRLFWWCLGRIGFVSGAIPGLKHSSNITTPKNLTAEVMDQSPPATLSDVSSVDSAVSSLDASAITSKRVCQAHLLHYADVTSDPVSVKPCLKKPAKAIPLLNVDCSMQGGVRASRIDDPVVINLRNHHREKYALRTVEI